MQNDPNHQGVIGEAHLGASIFSAVCMQRRSEVLRLDAGLRRGDDRSQFFFVTWCSLVDDEVKSCLYMRARVGCFLAVVDGDVGRGGGTTHSL